MGEDQRSSWIGWLPAVVLYLSIPAVAFGYHPVDFVWSKQAASNVFLLVALVTCVPLLLGKSLRKVISADLACLLVLTLWAGFSAVWAVVPIKVFKSATMLIAAMVGFGLSRFILGNKTKAFGFILISMGTGVLVAVFGILQYYLDSGMFTIPRDQFGFKDLATTYGLSNFTVDVLVIILPFGLGVALSRKSHLLKWAGIVSTLLILHYLVVSHVRAGYLSIFFVMAFFAMLMVLSHRDWMRKHRRTILIGTAVLVLCALVIRPGSVLPETFLPRFDLEEPTIKIRVHIWKQALEIIEDYPVLGVGLGNYEVIAWKYLDQTAADMTRESNTRIDRTHNEYLNLACELGMVGLFMFLAFLGLLAAKTVIWLERNSGREEFWVVAALTAGVLGGLVNAMFTFPFQMPGSIHQFFLTAGILSGLVAQSDPIQKGISRISPRLQYLLQSTGWVVVTLGLLISVNWNLNFFNAEIHYQRGLSFKQAGLATPTLEFFDKGLGYDPFAERIHYDKAFILANLGRFEEASESLALGLEQTPFFEKARVDYALFLANLGQTDQALEFLAEVLQEHPSGTSDVYLYRASLYLVKGDSQRAFLEISKSMDLRVNDANSLEAVMNTLTKVETGLSDNAQYWYFRAIVEARSNRTLQARASIRESVALDPLMMQKIQDTAHLRGLW